eukprot:11219249-Alexandrium_andersonii.AAC.1
MRARGRTTPPPNSSEYVLVKCLASASGPSAPGDLATLHQWRAKSESKAASSHAARASSSSRAEASHKR